MKKIFLIILIFIFVSGAYGQQFKLMGGPTISNYSDSWPSGIYWIENTGYFRSPFQNSKTGFLGGIGIEFALNKNVAFELEGLYFQKGSTFDLLFYMPFPGKETYNMNGISFPLLVRVKFLPRPFPYVTGGSEFSLILSHSRMIKKYTIGGYIETREDLLKYTKKIDFGLVFGIGFELKVSNVLCFFEGRYNLGQRNLHTWPPEIIYLYPPKIKTCALQIIGGFKI